MGAFWVATAIPLVLDPSTLYGVNLDDKRNSLVPHLTLYDQLVDMPILGARRNSLAGRGSEPVGRRGPEFSLKVSPMTRGPMLKIYPPQKMAWAPPPPLKRLNEVNLTATL